ncbi:hypothetical protein GOBAR_AA27187 [Gossypium barbadense]|uniref:Uncharacterized protein n=1 Tax=Gossypium barbadense TaxID=3634 RepID=A0A2P5WQV3_GOSBA|nr:hypothetical protein GOBAR_AA27187 [Gossypium barbadense]
MSSVLTTGSFTSPLILFLYSNIYLCTLKARSLSGDRILSSGGLVEKIKREKIVGISEYPIRFLFGKIQEKAERLEVTILRPKLGLSPFFIGSRMLGVVLASN